MSVSSVLDLSCVVAVSNNRTPSLARSGGMRVEGEEEMKRKLRRRRKKKKKKKNTYSREQIL